jgi:glycosyltransferase involved in cell wall biosynthesis
MNIQAARPPAPASPAPSGLVIWVYSYCRSTLATYAALRRRASYPVRLVLCAPLSNKAREDAGFSADEFPAAMFDMIDPDEDEAQRYLTRHAGDAQLFSFYHPASRHVALPRLCADSGIPFGVISEAPCNMESASHRRVAKHLYYRWLLPRRVSPVVDAASLFANMSGSRNGFIDAIGWDEAKTLEFGYFPPPLPGSRFIARVARPPQRPTLLLSGGHTSHRDPMTFMRALRVIAAAGQPFRALICGRGPLTGEMQAFAEAHGLPAEFRGMVPLDQLVRLYETADLFIAPGAREPWGIRVNDALNCGCPVLASTGMGASVVVERHGCGGVFAAGDPEALAALIGAAVRPERWEAMVAGTRDAAAYITPDAAAERLGRFIDQRLALPAMAG